MFYVFYESGNESVVCPQLIRRETLKDLVSILWNCYNNDIESIYEFDDEDDYYDESEEVEFEHADRSNPLDPLLKKKTIGLSDLSSCYDDRDCFIRSTEAYSGKEGLIQGYNEFVKDKLTLDSLDSLFEGKDINSLSEDEIFKKINESFEEYYNDCF